MNLMKSKQFAIECKHPDEDTWGVWARYRTERARQEALKCLNGGKWKPIVEFRPQHKESGHDQIHSNRLTAESEQ